MPRSSLLIASLARKSSPPHPSSPLSSVLQFFASSSPVASYLTTPTPHGARPFSVHSVTLQDGGDGAVKDKWVKDLRDYVESEYEMNDEGGVRECVCLYPEQMIVACFKL